MAEQLFSGSWYRVRDLTPRLRSHTEIQRQLYRGEVWYVLRDAANEKFHRFTPAANYVIGLMDGQRSVEEIWNCSAEELGDDAPTQDEMIQLLGQLHGSDVLQCDVSPDAQELFSRWEKHEKQQLKSKLMSPFSIRLPLIDPERFLSATVDLVRPLYSPAGAAVWLLVVLPALVLAGVHWTELTENVLDRMMTPQNMVAVWLLFPIIKVLHELGHGYTAKVFGGEVHDMGVMFLVFTPVPYVDASSSWAFTSKFKRALVGAGGMVSEVFVASLAFYVWLGAETGAVRAIAYNVLIIAGITTLLFNANPLLRFDGYYILSDLIEIPNLRTRANKYISYLTERHLFGNDRAERPQLAPGEAGWFVFYPVAAFIYRMFIVVAIFSWILDQFFFIGLLLGAFAAVGWVGMPLYKGLKYLISAPSIRRVRGRAWAVSGGGLALALLFIFVVPMPLRSMSEGVVWIPDEAFVRAGTEGFVEEVVAEPGSFVSPGELLIRTHDPVLDSDEQRWDGRVRELEARYAAERSQDVATAEVTREELRYARQELARIDERRDEFDIRAHTSGEFVISRSDDWPGRFVRQGQLMAHVVDIGRVRVRAVVDQDDADLVRFHTEGVEVRLAERIERPYAASLVRVVPAASDELPSLALGSAGGGEMPSDPTDPQGNRSMMSVFQVDIDVPEELDVRNAGGRVFVRFDHGVEPLAAQWYRRVRQLFLSRFQV